MIFSHVPILVLLEATLWNFSNPKLHQYAMVTFSLTALLAIGIRFQIVLSCHHLLLKKEQRLFSNRIRRMRMKWTGHILRMCDSITVKQVFSWEPSSRRSQGRPKKRWMECVEEDLHRAGISRYGVTTGRQRVSFKEIAVYRSQWKELVAA